MLGTSASGYYQYTATKTPSLEIVAQPTPRQQCNPKYQIFKTEILGVCSPCLQCKETNTAHNQAV
jgi:hypothetical protein